MDSINDRSSIATTRSLEISSLVTKASRFFRCRTARAQIVAKAGAVATAALAVAAHNARPVSAQTLNEWQLQTAANEPAGGPGWIVYFSSSPSGYYALQVTDPSNTVLATSVVESASGPFWVSFEQSSYLNPTYNSAYSWNSGTPPNLQLPPVSATYPAGTLFTVTLYKCTEGTLITGTSYYTPVLGTEVSSTYICAQTANQGYADGGLNFYQETMSGPSLGAQAYYNQDVTMAVYDLSGNLKFDVEITSDTETNVGATYLSAGTEYVWGEDDGATVPTFAQCETQGHYVYMPEAY